MKFGVVVFPGSNCDHDAFHAVGGVLEKPVEFIWHQSENLSGFDAVILPGGFSYGDYLRTGAIARFSPVMRAVEKFARAGGLVLGICNGFQILCEAGLLPGALMRNTGLRFICRHVHIRVENTDTPFTSAAQTGQVLHIPIAHADGNYACDDATLAELQRHDQIVFRYCAPDGSLDPAANPNGSRDAIAGICNRRRNVMGMMPHPERAVESALGSTDGLVVFRSLIAELSRQPAAQAKVS
jgi:phosphoribosylformylglycinamidine synthase subunit PurQ / glutaminase